MVEYSLPLSVRTHDQQLECASKRRRMIGRVGICRCRSRRRSQLRRGEENRARLLIECHGPRACFRRYGLDQTVAVAGLGRDHAKTAFAIRRESQITVRIEAGCVRFAANRERHHHCACICVHDRHSLVVASSKRRRCSRSMANPPGASQGAKGKRPVIASVLTSIRMISFLSSMLTKTDRPSVYGKLRYASQADDLLNLACRCSNHRR